MKERNYKSHKEKMEITSKRNFRVLFWNIDIRIKENDPPTHTHTLHRHKILKEWHCWDKIIIESLHNKITINERRNIF